MKNNLEKIRKEHGINQEELAKALEILGSTAEYNRILAEQDTARK